ncbi:hypothetical protein R1flu_023046 [Riccia fluitans]|uniref:Uncharacterized protein n=1 Tax=Riccia fluitans TaxID=41844 RepID=A0ABD1XRE7_9MARC
MGGGRKERVLFAAMGAFIARRAGPSCRLMFFRRSESKTELDTSALTNPNAQGSFRSRRVRGASPYASPSGNRKPQGGPVGGRLLTVVEDVDLRARACMRGRHPHPGAPAVGAKLASGRSRGTSSMDRICRLANGTQRARGSARLRIPERKFAMALGGTTGLPVETALNLAGEDSLCALSSRRYPGRVRKGHALMHGSH